VRERCKPELNAAHFFVFEHGRGGLSIVWMVSKNSNNVPKQVPASGPKISTGGDSFGHQIAGNIGSVQIGDVHHQTTQPAIPARDYRAEWLALSNKMRASDTQTRNAPFPSPNIQPSSPGGFIFLPKTTRAAVCHLWGMFKVRFPG
jgi:hypothetical protein